MPLDGIKTYFRVKPLPRFVLPYSGFCFDGYLEETKSTHVFRTFLDVIGQGWNRKIRYSLIRLQLGWAEFKAWVPIPVRAVLAQSFNINGQYAFKAWRLYSISLIMVGV